MSKVAALYTRVSTDDQTTENQLRELRLAIKRQGWEFGPIFTDQGISGAKGRAQRPGLDALLRGVARRDFQVVAVWSVDRLGRSLQDLLSVLSELLSKRVDLYLHLQHLDTTTPSGKAMFSMLGVFGEFERAMIQERVKAGMARARAEGKQCGRPRVSAEVEGAIRMEYKGGKGIRKVARELGVGVSVVQRVLKQEPPSPQ
ncbi:MAG: recombinase family protein [Rhodospirillaceae bacterium]|nr:MAG: recombinase family protein [Rhodospirillaceae bacterium]